MEEMMKAMLDMSLGTWERFWNGSLFYILPAAALVYLLIRGWKSRAGAGMAFYQILAGLVFFCPATAWVLQKCVGDLVYWRVIWLFPIVPLTAYAMTLRVTREKSRFLKVVQVGVFILCIAFGGTSVWQAGNFERVGNRQQIPDTVAAISTVIVENRTSKDSLVATDDYVGAYLRVYEPSVRMPYGREGRGMVSRNAKYLHKNIVSPEPNYRNIIARAKKEKCEFLVIQVPSRRIVRLMRSRCFRFVEKVDNYGVFQSTLIQ